MLLCDTLLGVGTRHYNTMFLGTNSSDRLQGWRNIRNTCYTSAECLILEFPYASHTERFVDFYTTKTWPSIFEIVSNGHFCQSGITLIMTLSLHHAGFISGEELSFPVINNNTNGNTGLVLEHDGLVYNFKQGTTVSVDEAAENSTLYTTHNIKIKQLFS